MASGLVRRSAEDYAAAFARLLPVGAAWPRDQDSVLMGYIAGQAAIWGRLVDSRAADLIEIESDPRETTELLAEWERAFGLPDPCAAETPTIADRRRALLNRMTAEGAQSRAFFIGVAAALGYTITIREFSPWMCGVSRCGNSREPGPDGMQRWEIGPPEMRFYWVVRLGQPRLSWFRLGNGGGQVGIDPHLRIALATDLECLIRRWKPAHTEVIFSYTGAGTSDPMAGTP